MLYIHVFGGVLSHVSIFIAMTALVYGHDVELPCLIPHWNSADVDPCLVIMVTGTLCIVSSAHSTYPVVGHPLLHSSVQRSYGVIRSKNFSSSSLRCPRCVFLY